MSVRVIIIYLTVLKNLVQHPSAFGEDEIMT